MKDDPRSLLEPRQHRKICNGIVNSLVALSDISKSIKNLGPKIYFFEKTDDFRFALDMKIFAFLESFIAIRNASVPSGEKFSIYISLYPEISFEGIRNSRNMLAHCYVDLEETEIWKFISEDLWKLYNFIVCEMPKILRYHHGIGDVQNTIYREILSSEPVNNPIDVFCLGALSEFSLKNEYSEEELAKRRRIIEEWERGPGATPGPR